jgi:peroxin-6
MVYDYPTSNTLKRKRRREDKPALSARLYLDSSVKGELGVVSEDLLQQLYPKGPPPPATSSNKQEHISVAITPWTPNASASDALWAVIPIATSRRWNDKPLPNNTIRFPAGALSTQSIVNLVQAVSPNKTLRQNAAIEIRVSDVVPLPLETVFVSLDTSALQKLEDAQKRFAGGFSGANGHLAPARGGKRPVSQDIQGNEADVDESRRKLVEQSLSETLIVHTGDQLPLALSHPVTHGRAPPAKVLACEPVSQGCLTAATKIVIVSATDKQQPNAGNRGLLSLRLPEETEDEDTSNETFFSATESPAKPIVVSKSTTDFSNTDDLFNSSTEENLSDDSDDMISLARPGSTDQPSGLNSALTAATPRPFSDRLGDRLGGTGTPGSVFSHMSSSTVRGTRAPRSKVFRTQGLLEQVSDELLHPRPAAGDDEEARAYVDAGALARLGCFSGDWITIEESQSQMLPHFSAFAGFEDDTDKPKWRPVKIYGLPESMAKRPQRYQVNTSKRGRRDSISSLVTNSANVATVYLSPILLANLNSPTHVSVSPLQLSRRSALKRNASGRPGSASPQAPPVASEMTLRKVVTPVSSERALNNMLFTNLKEHLERKQRIVKDGDLIAIPIDESLGRSIYEGEAEQDGTDGVGAMYKWSAQQRRETSKSVGVAWFAVESIKAQPTDVDSSDAADTWGGAATIDPSATAVRQSGDEKRKLPSTSTNPWQFYLGVRRATARGTNVGSGPAEAPEAYISPLQRRLRELMSVSISPRAIHLGLPPLTVLLTSTQRSIGKAYSVQRVCADLGMHFFSIDAFDIASEGGSGVDVQTQGLLEARCARALESGGEFTAVCIKHLEQLPSERIATSLKDVLSRARVLVATTTDIDKIPDSVRGLFTHELEMSAPDEGEREGILRDILASSAVPLASEVDLSSIAVKTAALVAGDLLDVAARAYTARETRIAALCTSASQALGFPVTRKDLRLSGGSGATSLLAQDFQSAVDLARKNFADSIGAPKIPNVQWSDVGGLTHVKDAVSETIQLPLSRPDLFAKGLKKRSGILFYGPPGTGKTLLAKAIATEFSLNFFSVKGPELLNMYIGESEANVRRVFQRARDARPCVVFFDELDSVAPKRGNQGDSGGVMDRIVSQLLAELDGMSDGEDGGGGVFVIGATNRPDLLDQALLRPGRFDKMLYLGISDTHDKQATILQALTRK